MIVCFGDSITYGQGLEDPTVSAFPALLSALLPEQVESRAVCSDTTRLGLERFPSAVQALAPRLVVIQFGHNDCNAWATDKGLPRVSLRGWVANLQEMVARAEAFNSRVVFLAPHPTRKGAEYERRRKIYEEAMRQHCPEPVVQAFDRADPELMVDLIHPNEAGHKRIALALLAHLEV